MMSTYTPELEELVNRALRMPPEDQARLVTRIVTAMSQHGQGDRQVPLPDLYGSWADLGFDISEADLEEVRREVWANFPREDILE